MATKSVALLVWFCAAYQVAQAIGAVPMFEISNRISALALAVFMAGFGTKMWGRGDEEAES